MSTYIAMLRGINVSGHKTIKMEQLRACFAGLGFSDVKTYVQSGNVIFSAAKNSEAQLKKMIEQRISRDFGHSVPIFLRTSKKMAEVIQRNPFLNDRAIDPSKLHVTFLSDAPPKAALDHLKPLAAQSEKIQIIGREIYLYCPDGYGSTKLSNTAIEKKLSVGATTRNWKTVNTLMEMA
ncbi:MAG: DUF1697 domain-containing protein [Tepidisphaeraceae bacterium]